MKAHNLHHTLVILDSKASEIQSGLKEWIGMSQHDLTDGLRFILYTYRDGHVIQADEKLGDEHFQYLVNYMQYINEVDYRDRLHAYTVPSSTSVYPQVFIGKLTYLFVPLEDEEHDNVFGRIEASDKVLKFDFGGKVKEADIQRDFHKEEITEDQLTEVQTYVTKRKEKVADSQSKGWKIFSTFRAVLAALVLLGAWGYFVSQYNNLNDPKKWAFILGFGFWAYLFSDHSILQQNKNRFLLFVCTFWLALYAYVAEPAFQHVYDHFVTAALAAPFFLIVVQIPVRLLFKMLLKREPVVEKPITSFWNLIYMLLLVASLGLSYWVTLTLSPN